MRFSRPYGVVALVLGIVTLVLGVISVVIVFRTLAFIGDSSIASGQVIELVSSQSCDRDDGRKKNCTTVYAPRVRFTTATGQEVVYLSHTSSNPPTYAEGERVDVRYRSDAPSDVKIDSVTDLWLGAIITGGISLFFAGFCGIWIFATVRVRAQRVADNLR